MTFVYKKKYQSHQKLFLKNLSINSKKITRKNKEKRKATDLINAAEFDAQA